VEDEGVAVAECGCSSILEREREEVRDRETCVWMKKVVH